MELGDTILDSTDEDRCEFCLKLPEEEQQIVVSSSAESAIRNMIEFVLGVTMDSGSSSSSSSSVTSGIHCCQSCWATFESYHDFKTNCLQSMKTRRKILACLKREVKMDIKEVSISVELFQCKRCQEQFMSQAELDEHVTRYCFDTADSSDSVYEIEEIEQMKPLPVQFEQDPENDDDQFWKEDRAQVRIFPTDYIFCCPRCHSLFNELKLLQAHKKECNAPRKTEPPGKIEINEQGVKQFHCNLCKCSYHLARLLEFHMHKHYDTPEFVCRKGCNRTFYFSGNRSNHEKHCYNDNQDKVKKRRRQISPDNQKPRKMKMDYPPGFRWCCPGCKTLFDKLGLLNQHKKSCEEAQRAKKSDRIEEEIEPDANGVYKCTICASSSFKASSPYSFHMNRHYDERKFACRVREGCNRAFFSTSLRNLHERDCQKETGYICTKCGDELKSRDTLRVHMRSHGKDNYECMICSKRFKQRLNYRSHWERHYTIRGNDPDPAVAAESNIANVEHLPRDIFCELCQRGLPSHGIYARHRRYCNQPEPPKPLSATAAANRIQCEECPKSFSSQERFQEHRNRHLGIKSVACRMEGCTAKFFNVHTRNTHEMNCGKQWVCSVCGLLFQHRATLQNHMETHSGRPPICKICNKQFSSKTSLAVHAVTHTKEKKYACPICDRRFTQNSSVKTHLKIHSDLQKQGIDLSKGIHQVFLANDG